MNEILFAILLSIIFTGIAYGIAELLMKLLKIDHPKNTFFIYFIVFLLAITIVPLTSICLSESMDIHNKENMNESLNHLTNTPLDNLSTSQISSRITPLSNTENGELKPEKTPSKYILEITWYDLIIDENVTKRQIEKTSNTKDLSENEQQDSFMSSLVSTTDSLPPFILFSILLFSCAFFIVVYYVFFGKKHYLSRIHAIPSRHKKLNNLVGEISNELHLKIPKMYLYNGTPNAFVLGHPAVLVVSNKLLQVLSEKELKTALRHELTHIKHHDVLLKAFIQSVRIFCFYNPFIHLIAKKVFNSRELLADARYNTSHDDKISFMEALIKIAEYSKASYGENIANPALSVSLLELSSAHPTMTERFISLFKQCKKKTILTILISFIIVFTNISAVLFTQSYFAQPIEPDSSSEKIVNVEKQYLVQDITYTTIYQDNEPYRGKMIHRTLYNVISLPTFSNNSNIKEIINYILLCYYSNQQETSAF